MESGFFFFDRKHVPARQGFSFLFTNGVPADKEILKRVWTAPRKLICMLSKEGKKACELNNAQDPHVIEATLITCHLAFLNLTFSKCHLPAHLRSFLKPNQPLQANATSLHHWLWAEWLTSWFGGIDPSSGSCVLATINRGFGCFGFPANINRWLIWFLFPVRPSSYDFTTAVLGKTFFFLPLCVYLGLQDLEVYLACDWKGVHLYLVMQGANLVGSSREYLNIPLNFVKISGYPEWRTSQVTLSSVCWIKGFAHSLQSCFRR